MTDVEIEDVNWNKAQLFKFVRPFFSVSGAGGWFYIVALFLIMSAVTAYVIIKCRPSLKIFLITIAIVIGSFIFRIFSADFVSADYRDYLSVWLDYYNTHTVAESMRSNISNYVPLYNYFLILFTHLPVYDLYLIKLLSTVFEMFTALALTLIIARLTKKNINPLIFAALTVFPLFILNSSVHAQSDAIYTFFGLMGFYYALQKRSLSACVFFGLSFAIKLQAILIMPIILVFLVTRHIKWAHLPIIPVAYFVLNAVPMFFGKSFINTYNVYFRQAGDNNEWLSLVGNVPWLFNLLAKINTVGFWFLTIQFLIITAGLIAFILTRAVKVAKTRELTTADYVFVTFLILAVTMFFMPKMLFRFYYFTIIIGVIWLAFCPTRKNALIFAGISSVAVTQALTYLYGYNVFFFTLQAVAFVSYAVALGFLAFGGGANRAEITS